MRIEGDGIWSLEMRVKIVTCTLLAFWEGRFWLAHRAKVLRKEDSPAAWEA